MPRWLQWVIRSLMGFPGDPSYDQYDAWANLRRDFFKSQSQAPVPSVEEPVRGVLIDASTAHLTRGVFASAGGMAALDLQAAGFSSWQSWDPAHPYSEQLPEKAKNAVADLIRTGNASYREAQELFRVVHESKPVPVPALGQVTFYLLVDSRVLTADAMEEELERGDHRLSPLYQAEKEAFAQLRDDDPWYNPRTGSPRVPSAIEIPVPVNATEEEVNELRRRAQEELRAIHETVTRQEAQAVVDNPLLSALTRPRWRATLAKVLAWLGWPVLIVGFVVGFLWFFLRISRAMRRGYSGSQADAYIAESWALMYLCGLATWTLALLGGAIWSLWFLLK